MAGVANQVPGSVGRLEIIERDSPNRVYRDLTPGKELILGRNKDACNLVLDDPCISGRHLKFYSIIHDQQRPSDIQPMVYVADVSSYGVYWNGSFVGPAHPPVLLSDGDLLKISPRYFIHFHSLQRPDRFAFDIARASELKCFADKFQVFPRRLGKGAQASVHLGLQCATNRQVACKIINLRNVGNDVLVKNLPPVPLFQPQQPAQRLGAVDIFPPEPRETKHRQSEAQRRQSKFVQKLILREVKILQSLDHPNVINLVEAYQAEETFYLFEDLVAGGDLYSYIEYKGGVLHEVEAGVIVRQLLEALKHIHGQDIVHRDVKPDNILISSLRETAKIVLTDFGSARYVLSSGTTSLGRMETRVGTVEYCAPEILGMNKVIKSNGYTKAVDMWSTGCVTAALLTGSTPFWCSNVSDSSVMAEEAFLRAAAECNLQRLDNDLEWQSVGHPPKDFVRRLVTLNEDARMTASEALDHDWFSNPSRKDRFDALYQKAIGGWKPTLPPIDRTKRIDFGSKKPRLFSSANPQRLRKPNKKLTPIEAHYNPCHKNVQCMLYPRKDKSLPTTDKTSKERKSPFFSSAMAAHRPDAVAKARTSKAGKSELLKVEDLFLFEPEKHYPADMVPNSQETTLHHTQPENIIERRVLLPLGSPAPSLPKSNKHSVLSEHPKDALITPQRREPGEIKTVLKNKKQTGPLVADHKRAELSSVSPLQRKMPKTPQGGPLRSKQVFVDPGRNHLDKSNADRYSWTEKIPKKTDTAINTEKSSTAQAKNTIPPELSRKRHRESTVEDEQELAILTQASMHQRHFITVNAFREVIAQKRAKLTHTLPESELLQMEVKQDEEVNEGDEDEVV